jgi:hypothetical protein
VLLTLCVRYGWIADALPQSVQSWVVHTTTTITLSARVDLILALLTKFANDLVRPLEVPAWTSVEMDSVVAIALEAALWSFAAPGVVVLHKIDAIPFKAKCYCRSFAIFPTRRQRFVPVLAVCSRDNPKCWPWQRFGFVFAVDAAADSFAIAAVAVPTSFFGRGSQFKAVGRALIAFRSFARQ